MPIFATAGAKLYIGGPLASKLTDFVVGDFAAQSWIEVAWIENLGVFGDMSAEIKFDAIGQGRTIKLKGIRDAGQMAVVAGVDHTDPGQNAVKAAQLTPNDYAFMVQFNDKQTGGSASTRNFVAKVMNAAEELNTANNVIKLNMTLGISSNVVGVDASP